jgi:hypothetical protein
MATDNFEQKNTESFYDTIKYCVKDVLDLAKAYLLSTHDVLKEYSRMKKKYPNSSRAELIIDAGFEIVDRQEDENWFGCLENKIKIKQ